MTNDETGEVRILDEDPERVVSVTIGELQKPWTIQSDDWLRNPTVHERTCENVSEKDFEFECSNCHAYTDSPNSYRVEIGYKSGLHNNLNYCPYCGARVTDGKRVWVKREGSDGIETIMECEI